MKEKILRYYDFRANRYHDLDAPSILGEVRKEGLYEHLKIMNVSKKDRILDVGCGTGRFLRELSKISDFVCGLDFSAEMLNKVNSSCFLVRGDAEYLPFKDNSFDVVNSAGLTAVFKSTKMIREMIRASNNLVIISFPKIESFNGYLFKIFNFFGKNSSLFDFWYSEKEIREIFNELGFEYEIKRLGHEYFPQRLSKHMFGMWVKIHRYLRKMFPLNFFTSRYVVIVRKKAPES
ncbi:MAG: class I SAM-dependent methyltransferase [Candidatus Hydrothermarchaeota archaeon]